MIEIIYTNGEIIVINLFDNSIKSKFIETYGENSNIVYDIGDCNLDAVTMNYSGRGNNILEINQAWSQILEGLDGMKMLGNEINIELPTEFDFNQQTLNTLHRVFTYCDLYHDDIIKDYPFCDNYTKDIGISFEEYHSIIDKINQGVHTLELWAKSTDNRKYAIENFPLGRIRYITNTAPAFEKPWCEFTDEEYQENFNFLNYDYEHIVTLTDTILGKSPLNSFLDDDNPLLPDCTGRYATDGSFKINRGRELRNLYKSNYFIEWASKYGKTPEEFPLELAIGYVDTIKTTKNIDYFFNNNLTLKTISIYETR